MRFIINIMKAIYAPSSLIKTCFFEKVLIASSISPNFFSSSAFLFCIIIVFIVIGIFSSMFISSFLVSCREFRVCNRSSSESNLVPLGYLDSSASFFLFYYNFYSFSFFSSISLLYFCKLIKNLNYYSGTLPKFL